MQFSEEDPFLRNADDQSEGTVSVVTSVPVANIADLVASKFFRQLGTDFAVSVPEVKEDLQDPCSDFCLLAIFASVLSAEGRPAPICTLQLGETREGGQLIGTGPGSRHVYAALSPCGSRVTLCES